MRGLARAVALAAFVQVATGCAYIGAGETVDPSLETTATVAATATSEVSVDPTLDQPTGIPTVEPTEAPSSTPEPTFLATPIPTFEPTPEPTPAPSPSFVAGLDASNEFWNPFFGTCFFGVDDWTLREMVSHAHVVVRGAVVGARELDVDVYSHISFDVMVTEVIKGQPAVRPDGTIDVRDGLETLPREGYLSQLPEHENLWFLWAEQENGPYYMSDYTQTSVIRNIDGLVRVINPRRVAVALSPNGYPMRFEGTDFEVFVQRVRDLAAGQLSQRLLPGTLPGLVDGHSALAC